tara:strand:- start:395 stop:685 length:291 start_codon:yes stop_codon:yes gene_type:complete
MNLVIINILCDLKFFKIKDILKLKLINYDFFNSCKYLDYYYENLIFENYFIKRLLFDEENLKLFFSFDKNLNNYKILAELLFDEYYCYKFNKLSNI